MLTVVRPYHKILLLFVAFIALRLFFIFTFPPFTDESLYIRWGQLMMNNPALRWASLPYVDRQPLAFWLFGIGAIVLRNPLLGARLMVLLVNIPTFFLMRSITKRLYSDKASFLALAVLACSPLFIMTQTTALMEGLLFPLSVLLLWIFSDVGKSMTWLKVSAIGILLAIGLWIKTTGLLLVLSSTIVGFRNGKNEKLSVVSMFLKILLVVLLILLLILPLISQPDFRDIFREPGLFAMSTSDLLHFPILIWISHTVSVGASLGLFLNPVVVLCGIAALCIFRKRMDTLLLWWLGVPIISMIILSKYPANRYIVIGTCALPPLLGDTLAQWTNNIKRNVWVMMLYIFIALYALFFVTNTVSFFRLLPNFVQEQEYALSWPSGYGIPELTRWIDAQIKPNRTLFLAVADSPGNPSDYFLAYYYFNPDVRITFATLTNATEFQRIQPIADKIPLFLVTRSTLLTPAVSRYLEPVKLFPKPYSQETVGIYRVIFSQTSGSL